MQISLEDNKKIILQWLGQDVAAYDDSFLQQMVAKTASGEGFHKVAAFLENLENNLEHKQHFIQSLRVGYSAFYREPLTYAVLDQVILPEIISLRQADKRKEIRIWSAASAAGQEAYTLAMLMENQLKCKSGGLCYRIFATDANPEQINLAQNGIYNDASLENLPFKMVNDWLVKKNEGFAIKDELKERITFSVFDLLNPVFTAPPESIFGSFDLVVCANLLFYYNPANRRIILKKMHQSMSPEAILVTGETETGILNKSNFRQLYQNVAIFRAY